MFGKLVLSVRKKQPESVTDIDNLEKENRCVPAIQQLSIENLRIKCMNFSMNS